MPTFAALDVAQTFTTAKTFSVAPIITANSMAFTAGGNFTLGTTDNFALLFRTNNLERMRIDNSGNVGIGTTSPAGEYFVGRHLRIVDASAASMGFERTTATARKWEIGLATGGNFDIIDTVASLTTPRVRIDISGNVGIGTTSPGARLHVPLGGILVDEEAADLAAPALNRAILYAKDNGAGKTQLIARFNTGAVQVIATEP